MSPSPGSPLPPPAWPQAALFDFDGLLVDTAECWLNAYRDVLARRSRKLDASLASSLAGASVEQAAAQLDVPGDELRARLSRAFGQKKLELLPGVRALTRYLGDHATLAVATNAPAALVRSALTDLGINDRFASIVSADCSPCREKPAPDVYLTACSELGVEPEEAIAFEDSPVGVLAARRAGLKVVYVPSNGLLTGDADLEVEDLNDPRLFGFIEARGSLSRSA